MWSNYKPGCNQFIFPKGASGGGPRRQTETMTSTSYNTSRVIETSNPSSPLFSSSPICSPGPYMQGTSSTPLSPIFHSSPTCPPGPYIQELTSAVTCSQNQTPVYTMVTPIPNSSSSERRNWSKADVLALLESYKERQGEFQNPKKRNKDIWVSISEEMENKGIFAHNGKDCETKFKNLKRAYVNTVDYNNTSGNDRKVCAYYDELHGLFQKDARITPLALCSNRKASTKQDKTKPYSDDDSTTDSELLNEDKATCTVTKRRRPAPQKQSGELVSLFKEFTQSREESEKQRMEKLEQMHSEKMAFMDRFLNVFEKSVSKQ